MADPTKYSISYSFTGFQGVNPATPLPAPSLDNELVNIEASIGDIVDAIKDVRRSDGQLKNGIVTREALAGDVSLGFSPPTPWISGNMYVQGSSVFQGFGYYRAVNTHLASAAFATDLAAGRWALMADFSALNSVTIPDNSVSTNKLQNTAVTLAKMADLPADTVIGRTGTDGAPQVIPIGDIVGGGGAGGNPGDIIITKRTTPPTGTLALNGAPVNRTVYAALDDAIYCGDADNASAADCYRCTDPLNPSTSRSTTGTHIVLPDWRGEFLRFWDNGRGIDAGRSMWQPQTHMVGAHAHPAVSSSSTPTFTGTAVAAHAHAGAGSTTGLTAPVARTAGDAVGGSPNNIRMSGATGGSVDETGSYSNLTETGGGSTGSAGGFTPGGTISTPSITTTVNNNTGTTETRPRNQTGLACIRY